MTYPPEPDPFATRETLLLRLRPDAPQRELAWREFYEIYGAIIGGFARNMGVSTQDISDMVQDVLVGFFGASPTFVYNPDRGRFRGYLKTCTWRVIQRKLRGRLKLSGRSVEDISDDEQPVEEAWNDCWEQEQLRRAMDEVRQRYMADPDTARTFKAFEMYAILEQPAEAIAERLQMSANSVHQAKSRVSKAIKAAFDRLSESTG